MEIYYEAIDLLKGMIERPSVSKDEKAIADFLNKEWEAAGHNVNRKGNNLWIIAPDFNIDKPTILLNSHIDTVKPASGYKKDPYSPSTSADGKLYGLGSNDAGGSVVSLYAAYTQLIQREQPYNLIYLASCEEEISGPGGMRVALQALPPISFGVVGEPTQLQPAVAEKGLMVLDCVTIGISGHAARDEGVNAITLALKDIQWFNTYVFPKQSDFLGPVKMSVTVIKAGTQHNVVPDRCEFTVDIRSNEFYKNEELFYLIKENVECEVSARSFRLNSSNIKLTHPFIKRAVLMGKEPFGSPTTSDQALMPFPTVKIGPGDSARSHSADEYIYLSEIREAIDTYVHLLDGLELS